MIDNVLIEKCEKNLQDKFKYFEDVALFNQEKVLKAFQKNKIALRHFVGTSGYGYGDEGRDVLNNVVADIFNAQQAICSPNIVSGTHALSLCLYGVLRPGDKVLCISGRPYDTLNDVIFGDNNGSLKDYGIEFTCVDLKDDFINNIDLVKEGRADVMKMVSGVYSIENALDAFKALSHNDGT